MWRLQGNGVIFVCCVSVKLRLVFTAGPYWQVVSARCTVWIFIDLWNLRPRNACSLSFLRPALKICVKNADFCVNANPGWRYQMETFSALLAICEFHAQRPVTQSFDVFFDLRLNRLLIPPLHRGCDLCASLVRPQNCPGRRWRQKGGRTVALVVQGWYTGRSGIAMDAMVAVKFWACSKQSHKGRRGGRSLTGHSKEAGWRHTHRRGRRMDAQWSAIGRPVKNANIVYQFERHVCLPCTTIVPPLDDQWRPLSDHCGDHCASIQRPRQHLSHHGDGSAFTLPSLRDLLCHYNSFGRSRKAQGSCCSSYTETELSGFRRPLSVLTIFMVAQGWHEGRSPV